MENIHPLEQHDQLYRLAYKKFLDNELPQARRLATQAIEKAHEYFLRSNLTIPVERFACRAEALLQLIRERDLLSRDS